MALNEDHLNRMRIIYITSIVLQTLYIGIRLLMQTTEGYNRDSQIFLQNRSHLNLPPFILVSQEQLNSDQKNRIWIQARINES